MISSHELARLCGVSQGTVDRALHNRGRISPATRARILSMAAQHGHLPNPVAHELMGHTTSNRVVALLADNHLRTPFFLDLLAETAGALRREGMALNIALAGEGVADLVACASEAAARRARALLLILPPEDLELPATLVAAQPVVSFLLPCLVAGVRNLLPDEHAIGRAATEHLLALGHRRIIHVHAQHKPHWAMSERAAGYVAAMTAVGLTPVVVPVRDPGEAAEAVRSHRATALFSHNDPLALGTIRKLQSRGFRVPADCSVIGVDGSPIIAAIDASLTSIRYPFAGLATQLVASLLDLPLPALPPPLLHRGATTAGLRE
jgi:LacI family transcriptional regulator, repressor for deo operon, udp, cdd, tsx, nupC, and nupG